MNILQEIFTDHYEEILYTHHPRKSEMENIDSFPCFYLRLFFVYSGAVIAPPVFCPDPNCDPNAEKSGGFIRTGKDAAVKFPERKGVEMP